MLFRSYDNFESAQEIEEITSDYEILSEEELEKYIMEEFENGKEKI